MAVKVKICRQRTACAVLASGVVISLTALTGGVAPAFAKPGDDAAGPTTTVVEPAPEAKPAQPEAPAEAPPAAEPSAAVTPPKAAPEKPSAPAAVAPEPVAPALAPSAVEAPSPSRAPKPAPSVESSIPSRAPASAVNPPASAANPPASSAEPPAPPSTRASVSETTQSPAAGPPSDDADAQKPPTPGLVAPSSRADDPSGPGPSSAQPDSKTPESSPSSATPSPSSSDAPTSSSSVSAPERTIEKSVPQTLVAPEEDVQIAKSAKVIEEKPVAAPREEIENIARVIDLPALNPDLRNQFSPRNDDRVRLVGGDWDRNVRQWRPDWVAYDEYYRPVLSNPYRDPVRIVYIYENAPRVVWIPPLARIVLEVAQYAAYSFTALVTNPLNQAANVAVGSFFGGGYYPGYGMPPPPPPPPLVNFANVPVQVRYSNATYEPFRVQKIVDVGDDPRYGERKVLLDGVTPAWGQWTQTASGERSFEVHKTQQFPGLDDPREAPLPGDYQLRLAAEESSSGMTRRDVYLVAVATACGVLSIAAVIASVLIGRRRRLGL